MSSKKHIIIAVAIIAMSATLFGIYRIITGYIFTEDFKVPNGGYNHLIEIIENTTDEQERRESIDHAVKYNLVTQEVANSLY